jgi:hypothetical protein
MKTTTSKIVMVALAAGWLSAGEARAAFVVGAHSSEKANATNFAFGGDTTSASASVASAAVGLTGTNSIYGGNGVNFADTYVFSYRVGLNPDNTTFTSGAVLGSTTGFPGQGNIATGAAGNVSGTYNVYFTSPSTVGISGGNTTFTITQNGAPIVVSANLNDAGTGPDTDPGPAFVGGANNAWFKLGTVNLVAGNTYTVTQEAGSNTFVSTRAHAVMWELAPVPEPATFVLAGLGLAGVGFASRRRRA